MNRYLDRRVILALGIGCLLGAAGVLFFAVNPRTQDNAAKQVLDDPHKSIETKATTEITPLTNYGDLLTHTSWAANLASILEEKDTSIPGRQRKRVFILVPYNLTQNQLTATLVYHTLLAFRNAPFYHYINVVAICDKHRFGFVLGGTEYTPDGGGFSGDERLKFAVWVCVSEQAALLNRTDWALYRKYIIRTIANLDMNGDAFFREESLLTGVSIEHLRKKIESIKPHFSVGKSITHAPLTYYNRQIAQALQRRGIVLKALPVSPVPYKRIDLGGGPPEQLFVYGNYVYTPVHYQSELLEISLTDFKVTRRFATAERAEGVFRKGDVLVSSGYGDAGNGSSVTIINLKSSISKHVRVASAPFGVWIDSRDRILVAHQSGFLTVLTIEGKLLRQRKVVDWGSEVVAVGDVAFCTDYTKNAVRMISINDLREISTINVGKGPQSVDVFNDIVAVSCRIGKKVVFLTDKGDIIRSVDVPGHPFQIKFTPSGNLLVALIDERRFVLLDKGGEILKEQKIDVRPISIEGDERNVLIADWGTGFPGDGRTISIWKPR